MRNPFFPFDSTAGRWWHSPISIFFFSFSYLDWCVIGVGFSCLLDGIGQTITFRWKMIHVWNKRIVVSFCRQGCSSISEHFPDFSTWLLVDFLVVWYFTFFLFLYIITVKMFPFFLDVKINFSRHCLCLFIEVEIELIINKKIYLWLFTKIIKLYLSN